MAEIHPAQWLVDQRRTSPDRLVLGNDSDARIEIAVERDGRLRMSFGDVELLTASLRGFRELVAAVEAVAGQYFGPDWPNP